MSGMLREAEPFTAKVTVERARPSMSIETGTRITASEKRIELHRAFVGN